MCEVTKLPKHLSKEAESLIIKYHRFDKEEEKIKKKYGTYTNKAKSKLNKINEQRMEVLDEIAELRKKLQKSDTKEKMKELSEKIKAAESGKIEMSPEDLEQLKLDYHELELLYEDEQNALKMIKKYKR